MRIYVSPSIDVLYPDIEELLWDVGLKAWRVDRDIQLEGLRVRVTKAREPDSWYGWAFPWQKSCLYGKHLIHPAGRIDLSIGAKVDDDVIITLFAHELRHIGQFHRGRQIYGYLTTQHMNEQCVETDCYEFEESILDQYVDLCAA